MEIDNKIDKIDESIEDDKLKLLYHINKREDNNQKTDSKCIKIILLIICICILPINPKKDYNNLINDNKSNSNIIFNNKTNNTNNNMSNIDNDNNTIFNNKTNKTNVNNINISSNIDDDNIINNKINNESFININNITYNNDGNNTKIKPILIYHSKTYPISEKINILNDQACIDKIKNQIEYAKNNSIYGFAFYYHLYLDTQTFNEPLDIIMNYNNLDMPFLLIFRNENKNMKNNIFNYNISKYVFDNRYIRINNKPIIAIYNPEEIPNLENNIMALRKLLKKEGNEEIFILGSCKEKNIDKLIKMNIFDGFLDSTSYDSLKPQKPLRLGKCEDYFFYFYLLYKNQDLNSFYNNSNKIIFRTSDIMSEYPIYINKKNVYSDYSLDKFEFLTKLIIDWTKTRYEKNRFIFINSFDNSHLSPNIITGKESLNKLRQLINPELIKKPIYNFSNLENNCSIAIQAHVFHVDLINDIINLTNNIPVKFDLLITTTKNENKNLIEKEIKKNSKANKYEILVLENKGRDVLPLLTQLKKVIHKYKYFCHIHTKKSINNWRRYLFYNLLGKNIISEILYEFESNDKLGLIFPPPYYEIEYAIVKTDPKDLLNLKKIFKRISDKIKIPDKFDFPAGTMFWARSEAVYQIIELNIDNECPKEPVPSGGTILHAIERTWKFITEYNGYTYKILFRYL